MQRCLLWNHFFEGLQKAEFAIYESYAAKQKEFIHLGLSNQFVRRSAF